MLVLHCWQPSYVSQLTIRIFNARKAPLNTGIAARSTYTIESTCSVISAGRIQRDVLHRSRRRFPCRQADKCNRLFYPPLRICAWGKNEGKKVIKVGFKYWNSKLSSNCANVLPHRWHIPANWSILFPHISAILRLETVFCKQ